MLSNFGGETVVVLPLCRNATQNAIYNRDHENEAM